MKSFFAIALALCATAAYGQSKHDFVRYNKIVELEATPYVITTYEDAGKASSHSQHMLFVNTKDGSSKQADFPENSHLTHLEQVHVDSLGMNCVLVAVNTNTDDKKLSWTGRGQVFVFSTDGHRKEQVTESNYYVNSWHVNRQTGTIVITGYVDANNNDKFDTGDLNQVIVYDLKTMKRLSVI